MTPRAIFLRRPKIDWDAFFSLIFWIAVLIGAQALLCFFCLKFGEGMGYAKASDEYRHKLTLRFVPPAKADVFESFGPRQCLEFGRAEYQRCQMSRTRKQG